MIKYIFTALILIGCFSLAPNVYSATYYIDTTQGQEGAGQCSTQDGLSTTTAFCNLDTFTEAARSAGDIAFMRRIATTTGEISDLTFTSDGTIANPIIISADYDNLWQDFATSSQTYTVAVGTTTLIASASITGIAAGDWIFFSGDCSERESDSGGTDLSTINSCEFAYEVKSIDGTLLDLYLPYKGNQSGSGLDLRVMPDNPQWNISTGLFSWELNTDIYWVAKGFDIRGDGASEGSIQFNTTQFSMKDSIIQNGGGAGDSCIEIVSGTNSFFSEKNRYADCGVNVINSTAGVNRPLISKNDIVTDTSMSAFLQLLSDIVFLNNITIVANAVSTTDLLSYTNSGVGISYIRGLVLGSSMDVVANVSTKTYFNIGIEDLNRFSNPTDIGNNFNFSTVISTTGFDPNILSTTSAGLIRSGGGATSIEVIPTADVSNKFDIGKIKLFEYPIYTDTTSKQYDVYFLGSTSTDPHFRTNPTVDELWIECEYWANNTTIDSLATSTRTIKKSTGTLDFVGQPSTWQNLSVTCQPTQTGILYLSGWYAKTQETTTDNRFFIDGKPVIQ